MKKSYKLGIMGAAVLTLSVAGSALAFHDGGVARCNGRHTMHNSELNAPIDEISSLPTQFTTGPFLLRSSDRSGACLNCHGSGTENHSYHVYTETADTTPGLVPEQYGPGGDFSWLAVGTASSDSVRDRRGHNIIAGDFGLTEDPDIHTSPGGDHPAANLACSSCHDPHAKYRVVGGTTAQVTTGAPIAESGSYGGTDFVSLASLATDEAKGVYRFLGGVGYESDGTVTPFGAPAPVALAPSGYNSTTALGGVRVAYGSDMSEWCGNCHGSIHNDSYPTNLRHPAGNGAALGTEVAANYNAYVSSGINTNTVNASYLALIPFETGDGYATDSDLNDTLGTTVGPSATNNVMCLSCHRAHASAFQSMLRWDYQASPFVVTASDEWHVPDLGLTQEQANAGYYNLPASDFGAFQRQLCNKCHAKD
jgi:predicted CXXCH cytochrome family protein